MQINCPICNGIGKITKPKTFAEEKKLKEKAINILHEQGFSIRAIMNFMNYKSPRAVAHYLNKNKKVGRLKKIH